MKQRVSRGPEPVDDYYDAYTTSPAPTPADVTARLAPLSVEPPLAGVVPLIGAALVGAAISLSLGVYGHVHQPTGLAIAPLHPGLIMLQVKSALASVGAGLALFQLGSAFWLYGRFGSRPSPRWLAPAHRWSGTVAFVLTLPVAYHCLWSLGFRSATTRVLVHSVLGCAFYGAFATKLLLLRSRRLPGWALPVAGGTLVSLLVGLWFTSAAWFYQL